MTVEYLDLADFLLVAEAVTGLDVPTPRASSTRLAQPSGSARTC